MSKPSLPSLYNSHWQSWHPPSDPPPVPSSPNHTSQQVSLSSSHPLIIAVIFPSQITPNTRLLSVQPPALSSSPLLCSVHWFGWLSPGTAWYFTFTTSLPCIFTVIPIFLSLTHIFCFISSPSLSSLFCVFPSLSLITLTISSISHESFSSSLASSLKYNSLKAFFLSLCCYTPSLLVPLPPLFISSIIPLFLCQLLPLNTFLYFHNQVTCFSAQRIQQKPSCQFPSAL